MKQRGRYLHLVGSVLRINRYRGAVLLLLALGAALVPGAALGSGPTFVSGTISTNTTWTLSNSPYVVTGNVTVASGVTLTIQPGVIVKFNGSLRTLYVNGTLSAIGTEENPIIFTSYQDDSAGGDTNGDGSATSGAPGQWYSISSSGTTNIAHASIRYGGNGSAITSYGAVGVGGGTTWIDHSDISYNLDSAVHLYSASASITNSTLSHNGGGVSDNNGTVSIDHTTITNSGQDAVWFNLASTLPASSITSSELSHSGRYGVYIGANGTYPLSSMPWGTRDNIYSNNGGAKQLAIVGYPSFTLANVNWRGNYWGDGVYYWYSDARCAASSPYSTGHLAYRSSSGNVPAGPLGGSTYYVVYGSTVIYCGYDAFKIGPTEYSPTKFDTRPRAPIGMTLGRGGRGLARNPTAYLSEPVDSATGNFVREETDTSLPGSGVSFALDRSYNSLDLTKGELGQGWTYSYAASLQVQGNGDVVVRGGDGQQVYYTEQTDGSFVGEDGALATLTSVSGGYELVSPDQTASSFNGQGQLTGIVDRDGQGVSIAYSGGLPSTITDAAGRVVTLTHSNGLLTQVALPGGKTVSYGYTNGLLTSVTDLDGNVWHYSYDNHNFLSQETDPLGHALFANTYGSDGRVSQQQDGLGDTTTFSWDPTTQTDTVTDARGHDWQDVYANNVFQGRVDPSGNETQLDHDTALDQTAATSPAGETTTMTYDDHGNMLTKTDPLGNTESWTYDQDNNVLSHTDALGNTTSYTYDSNGNVLTETDPLGNVTSYEYDSAGRQIEETDPDGRTTSSVYDDQGNLIEEDSPSGAKTTYAYDSLGRKISETDPLGQTTTYTYDNAGRLIKTVDPLGNTTTSTYDDAGHLIKKTDADGNATQYVYDADGRQVKVVNPDGSTTESSYDDAGNLIASTDALGNTTKYEYDADGRQTATISPSGSRTETTYDADGNVIETTDPLGRETTTKYDADGRETERTDPMGRKTKTVYDADGNKLKTIDALGNETTSVYDADGRLIKTIDPLGHATESSYDAAGQLTSETDANGNITDHAYDADGNEVSTTDMASGAVTSSVYDADGSLTSSTDADGNTTTYAYDAAGNKISETNPLNKETTYTYDANGNQLSETDPLGNTSTTAYDAMNRQTEQTDPLGNVTKTEYDLDGNVVATTDARGNTTTSTHDSDGNLVKTTDPLDDSTTFAYDAAGEQVSKTDANGHTTRYAYDDSGEKTAVTAPDGSVTSCDYDADGNVFKRTDANGHETTYTYDAAGNKVSKTDPLGKTWRYSYDGNGNLVETDLPSGDTITESYDSQDRLVEKSYSDGTPSVSYAYDKAGNKLSMTDGSGKTTYSYDDAGGLVGASGPSGDFAYSYNGGGNLLSRTYPDGTVTTYTYNPDSELASAESDGRTTSYDYNPDRDLTKTTLPSSNGYVETRSYDQAGRLVGIDNTRGDTTLSDFQATLDPVGNPTQIVRSGDIASTEHFTYDQNDRLTSVSGTNSPDISWTYDQVGNRLTETRGENTTDYSYNADDELTQAGSQSFSYDVNGNELSDGTRTFTYNAASELTSSKNGDDTTTYSYDGDGNRLQASSPAKTTNYVWDANGDLPQLAIERDGSGSLIRRYLYGWSRISMTTPDDTFYYHYDLLGSVADLTSSSGASEWTYAYEPFGSIFSQTKDDQSAPANPMQFAGEYQDPNGLYDLRAREYDPEAGRFLEEDPLEADTGQPAVAVYVYVGDQPTVKVDPSGECGMTAYSVIDPYRDRESNTNQPTQEEIAQKRLAERLSNISVDGYRMVYPFITVRAAAIARMPLSLACAMLSKETSGGLNEWGHDTSTPSHKAIFTGGYDAAHGKQWPEIVTKAAYLTYKKERGRYGQGGTQGVGPMQLTDAGLQNKADKRGGAWKPLPNMIVGFQYVLTLIHDNGLLRA
jgi:RHS repeat-associated protein